MKAILTLAVLGVLTAACALAASGSSLGAPSISAAVDRAVQVGPALAIEQSTAPFPAQRAPAIVKGRASDLGSSTPQPVGPRASTVPAASIPASQAHPSTCPAGSHLGILCTAP